MRDDWIVAQDRVARLPEVVDPQRCNAGQDNRQRQQPPIMARHPSGKDKENERP